MSFRCVLHGSFRKHLKEIREVAALFTQAGIEVIAPNLTNVVDEKDGFVFFRGEEQRDQRLIELLYLHQIKKLGREGFSYFVNPEGYIGTTASYELGIAQVTNIPCFFLNKPSDHPAYLHQNAVWSAENLATFITEQQRLPEPAIHPDEQTIHSLWQELMVPGSVVATGGMIEYAGKTSSKEKELLFVKTHKWGGRYSMIGGKVRRNETLLEALTREIKEETGLQAQPKQHLCTFDQIKNSGYYTAGTQHIFVDYIAQVDSKQVQLNEEAQEYVWMPAKEALTSLDLEPNAKHTVELYVESVSTLF